ncbi:MAG: helix-turn-helix transcriptional regulator [Woeseiaceae bacterium]
MAGRFESLAWHRAVARIVSAGDHQALADALVEAIGAAVEHEGTCLLAFHRDARPEVLHHSLEPAGRRHYVDRYLAGPYLLDPLYHLAQKQECPSLCRFRDEVPDRFHASPYYKRYCERTHLLDEMDYLTSVSPRTTLVLVVGRRTRRFVKAEVNRLASIEPLVQSVLTRFWQQRGDGAGQQAADGSVHRRLTECFDRFGEAVLTDREREISQLLLRGYSSKAIARQLDIAPGTVMVHKRNLFAKLGVSSQYQLFSLLIDALESGTPVRQTERAPAPHSGRIRGSRNPRR